MKKIIILTIFALLACGSEPTETKEVDGIPTTTEFDPNFSSPDGGK